MKKKNRVFN